jgi:hypothetical protein
MLAFPASLRVFVATAPVDSSPQLSAVIDGRELRHLRANNCVALQLGDLFRRMRAKLGPARCRHGPGLQAGADPLHHD